MTLQLTENIWELRIDTIFDAKVNQFYLGLFANPFVIVNVNSEYTSPVWRQAGHIGQAITFQDSLAYGELKEIFLESFLLLQFPLLSGEEYNLYYFPLPRLVKAKVKVWEYKGESINASINQIVNALQEASLPNIEKEITDLAKTVRENQSLNMEELEAKEHIIDNQYLPTGYYGY